MVEVKTSKNSIFESSNQKLEKTKGNVRKFRYLKESW